MALEDQTDQQTNRVYLNPSCGVGLIEWESFISWPLG